MNEILDHIQTIVQLCARLMLILLLRKTGYDILVIYQSLTLHLLNRRQQLKTIQSINAERSYLVLHNRKVWAFIWDGVVIIQSCSSWTVCELEQFESLWNISLKSSTFCMQVCGVLLNQQLISAEFWVHQLWHSPNLWCPTNILIPTLILIVDLCVFWCLCRHMISVASLV